MGLKLRSALYARPKSALAKRLALNDWPESKFWAWNIPATARTTRMAVSTSSPAASSGCHMGTPPTVKRMIIIIGEVSGKRLNPVASAP